VPPTDVAQLPDNYTNIYGAKLKGEVTFNAVKTWIEYINRLFGVFTGLFIFATLLASIPFLKRDRPIFYISLLAFLLVGFQGWLGSKVVSNELAPWIVTLHMLLAILIVFLLIYVMARSFAGHVVVEKVNNQHLLNRILWWTLVLSTVQIVMGTQVREAMDEVIKELGEPARSKWIGSLGLSFYIHRSFSLIILIFHLGLVYWLQKNIGKKGILYRLTIGLLGIVIVEILTGVILAYFNVPAFAQPIHLTLATIALGIQFVIGLFLNEKHVFVLKTSAQY
jgi:cytochrome c oxidase assembly protein subunit 15